MCLAPAKLRQNLHQASVGFAAQRAGAHEAESKSNRGFNTVEADHNPPDQRKGGGVQARSFRTPAGRISRARPDRSGRDYRRRRRSADTENRPWLRVGPSGQTHRYLMADACRKSRKRIAWASNTPQPLVTGQRCRMEQLTPAPRFLQPDRKAVRACFRAGSAARLPCSASLDFCRRRWLCSVAIVALVVVNFF